MIEVSKGHTAGDDEWACGAQLMRAVGMAKYKHFNVDVKNVRKERDMDGNFQMLLNT